jgi:hypothetical protein
MASSSTSIGEGGSAKRIARIVSCG